MEETRIYIFLLSLKIFFTMTMNSFFLFSRKTVLYRGVSFFMVFFLLIRGAPLTHVKYFDYENISLKASWQNFLKGKDLLQMLYLARIHSTYIVYLFAIKTTKLIPKYQNNIFKFLGEITDFYIVHFAAI